jgi:hypothetical protein
MLAPLESAARLALDFCDPRSEPMADAVSILPVEGDQPGPGIERAGPAPELTPGEIAALLEISQALSKHRDPVSLFAAIAAAVESVLPADRLIVLVPDSHGAAINVYAVRGANKLFAGERIPEGSVPAWVIQHREAMRISSTEQVRERFPATHRKLIEEGMQSAIVLPLLVADRCIGALSFMARDAGAFDGYSRRLLDEIASSVAVALDRCLAYEQLQRQDQERAALLAVNAAVGHHLEHDELFGAMAECLRDLVPTERFGIELPIEGDRLQGHLLTPRGQTAEPTQPTVLPAAGTACNWVMQNRQWMVVSSREELRQTFPVTFAGHARGGHGVAVRGAAGQRRALPWRPVFHGQPHGGLCGAAAGFSRAGGGCGRGRIGRLPRARGGAPAARSVGGRERVPAGGDSAGP